MNMMSNMNALQGMFNVKPVQLGNLPTRQSAAGGDVIDYARGDDQPLYHRKTLTAGTYTDQFFLFDQGHNGTISWPTTNIQVANQIPGEIQFDIHGLSIRFVPTAANVATPLVIADMNRLLRGLVVIYKNQQPRYRLWANRVGPGGGLFGTSGAAAVTYENGVPSVINHYMLFSPIPYQAEESFMVGLEWDQGGVTTSVDLDVEVACYGLRVGALDRVS